MNKKGQLTLDDAPQVVIIVALVFLIMASFAYIGVKYGDALATDASGSKTNETLGAVTTAGKALWATGLRNPQCTITAMINGSSLAIASPNYTVTNCKVYATATADATYTAWNASYTYNYDKVSAAVNVTTDLNTEIGNNTSIAGIVLTISLVGIVLSVLLGVFMVLRKAPAV